MLGAVSAQIAHSPRVHMSMELHTPRACLVARPRARGCFPGTALRQGPGLSLGRGPGAALDSERSTTASELSTHSWLWKNGDAEHKIRWVTAGCGPPVLLVHGFGASVGHYRRNIPALAAAGYKVYAIDLLGFGASDKPVLHYSMELWEAQLLAFMDEFVGESCVLVGNSIGSLAVLMATASGGPAAVKGAALINCAGGMNNKAVSDDFRVQLFMPLFLFIDWLLAQPRIARFLFDKFRTRDNIRQVLTSVYPGNPTNVDDALVELLYGPSEDEGALEAFCSILSGPPGPRPEALVPQLGDRPCLVLWGTKDPFTPADGPVGRYFQALPAPNLEYVSLEALGHCPHDEDEETVNAQLISWLQRSFA